MDDQDQVDRIVGQWARERPDLDTSAMAVVGRVSRLARTLEASIAPVLAEYDLQSHEFDVLATLRRSGPPYTMFPADLLEQMMVTSSTMTHRLATLEARALVRRGPCPDDGRRVEVSLTDAGRELVDQAVEAHYANEDQLLAALSPDERRQLADLLRRLALALE